MVSALELLKDVTHIISLVNVLPAVMVSGSIMESACRILPIVEPMILLVLALFATWATSSLEGCAMLILLIA